MDKGRLWHNFTHSGRVEDYLRYRGILPEQRATDSVQEEASAYGERPKTASDDRRSDPPGV